ncbi:MAG TPA: prephenate dehydrogenase [Segetibacter sp.]|nr:prephenate dehydrogenase [Segetibacter sp.]
MEKDNVLAEDSKVKGSEALPSCDNLAGVVTIIGTGLIGGSFALVLKDKELATKIIGVDNNKEHQEKALELGIVDEVFSLNEAIAKSKLIVLAVPVDALASLLPAVLDGVGNQVVLDMGSTKANVIALVANHPKRRRFVATHPMWGTEFSGPEAAVKTAFSNKAVVICDAENSDADALDLVTNLYQQSGMHLIYMDAAAHDLHAAYISHISHITSFALANTVLEKEKEEDAIFELASAGFESTVRLAKSNAAMWVPIFKQNRENVLDVLNEHISQLRKFKSCLEKENYEYLEELIEHANGIRRILK